MRFLDAQGALVALAAEGEGGGDLPLHVTAAEGTLAGLAGRAIAPTDPGLVVRSLSRERLELVRSSSGEPTRLLGDVAVDSAAAVSLRAHGVGVGALVIANPRDRTVPPEDMRLLSTLATPAAIVVAHPRPRPGARPERRGAGRGRDGSAGAGGAVDPKREARRGGAARLGRGARAQQPSHVDRRPVRAAARAAGARHEGPRAPARNSRAGGSRGTHRAEPADLRAEGTGGAGRRRSERRDPAHLAPHEL